MLGEKSLGEVSLDAQNFVTFSNVSKNYGSFRALDNLSFSIREGEVFGYIGPNGAGKTTTMKILIGLISDFSGNVSIGGCQIPKQKSEAHKLLGYLPQNVAFQDWRSVDHALTTFGKLSGLNDDTIGRRIPKILETLALGDVRYKKISKLSGGMIQKVGLAQALLHEPKLLVLDEPLGGLDPLSRRQFKDIILELSKKGSTIIFSSHILSDVQDVADRIGIINRGKILNIATLNELKNRISPQKLIEIQLTYVSDRWRELGTIDGVADVEQPTVGRILIRLKPDADADEIVDDVVKAIVRLGIRVRGISQLSPSLDEIYFSYVQEADNA
jgi:ABC-2 type transport system ATP-binding protein